MMSTTGTAAEAFGVDSRQLEPSARMREKFFQEIAALRLPIARQGALVTEEDLDRLPRAAQRYMRLMRVLERPRDVSFRAHWEGSFRMSPHQSWAPCEVWQYNASVEVTRILHMRLKLGGVLPTYVRDLYVHGGGQMTAKILDRFRMLDDASEKVTIGELVTYLNDALIFAPSMLLGPASAWEAVDDGAFDVSLTDGEHTVRARVHVDADGAMFGFSTMDRFGEEPANRSADLVATEWTTPIDGWELVGDRMRPTSARAVWHYLGGDFCYVELTSAGMDLAYDVAPTPDPLRTTL
jgi:hypothetical protein